MKKARTWRAWFTKARRAADQRLRIVKGQVRAAGAAMAVQMLCNNRRAILRPEIKNPLNQRVAWGQVGVRHTTPPIKLPKSKISVKSLQRAYVVLMFSWAPRVEAQRQ